MDYPANTASARMLRHPDTGQYCRSPRYLRYSDAGNRRLAPQSSTMLKVCKHCGSELYQVIVSFAVVDWRGDGRYRLEDAVRTFTREETAERFAREYSSTHVVRSFELSA